MLVKTVFFAFLAVAVLAENTLLVDRRQQFKQMLTEQCKKNNAEDKVPDIENSVTAFAECVRNLVDVQELTKEINEAKPNGALDEVFKKYCAKTPQLKTCIHTLMDGVRPCVDPSAHEQFNSAKNSTDQLIDFICYKDGDRIALFIADGGPECMQSKADEMKQCADKLKESLSSIDQVKSLTIQEKCAKFDELSTCLVNKLETCSNPTPANMAESLLKYIRKGTPCNTALPK